ncbi:hypothetical protein [Bosea sp. PAMC 26642]|uniref:hypothetical protein n=1 Tax=Bosea sp. (strain PAMC 26642) TaxID=1792307 RepID=UPI0007704B1D|nr:hypothetical protein [Bosea sp. PAMC 26642]AMJ62375.1 hypothetical protein AXW83_20580 [Bosea sp. PAMC 26642]
MLNNSLAPIKRAVLFFGFMGLAVATMTFGASLQSITDQSSATVAQAKVERNQLTDQQLAAVDPRQKPVSTAKRAIQTSQQAQLEAPVRIVSR